MTKTERTTYSKILNVSEDASADEIIIGYRLKLLQLKLGKSEEQETNYTSTEYYNAFRKMLSPFNIEDKCLNRIANDLLGRLVINSSLYSGEEIKLIEHLSSEILSISKNHDKCVKYNSIENKVNLIYFGFHFKIALIDLLKQLESYLHEKEVDIEELLEIINQQMHNEKLYKEFSNDGNHIRRKTNTYGEYVSFVGNKVLALGKLIFEIRNILSQNK